MHPVGFQTTGTSFFLSGGTRIPHQPPHTNQRGRRLPRALVIHGAQATALEHCRQSDLPYPLCTAAVNILALLCNSSGGTSLIIYYSFQHSNALGMCSFKVRVPLLHRSASRPGKSTVSQIVGVCLGQSFRSSNRMVLLVHLMSTWASLVPPVPRISSLLQASLHTCEWHACAATW